MPEKADIETELVNLMENSGALLTGHFRLSSGLHSAKYIQCALLLEDPKRAEYAGRHLAEALSGLPGGAKPDFIISPALGGLVIGHEVARAMGIRFIFTERVDGRMTLRRGFTVAEGERAIVVEDVVTTGGSTREVIDAVREAGGEVIAVGSIVNRGAGADFGAPFISLVDVDIVNYREDECPMCKDGKPVVKPGSRTKPDGKA